MWKTDYTKIKWYIWCNNFKIFMTLTILFFAVKATFINFHERKVLKCFPISTLFSTGISVEKKVCRSLAWYCYYRDWVMCWKVSEYYKNSRHFLKTLLKSWFKRKNSNAKQQNIDNSESNFYTTFLHVKKMKGSRKYSLAMIHLISKSFEEAK